MRGEGRRGETRTGPKAARVPGSAFLASPDAHTAWLGQPSQEAAFPAASDAVPGQSAREAHGGSTRTSACYDVNGTRSVTSALWEHAMHTEQHVHTNDHSVPEERAQRSHGAGVAWESSECSSQKSLSELSTGVTATALQPKSLNTPTRCLNEWVVT